MQPEDAPAGEAGQGVLHTRTVFHETWDKPISEIQYDPSGRVEQRTDYQYDDQGFMIREVLREGDGEVVEERSFEPDGQLRVKKAFRHYADGSYDQEEFFYDASGQLVKKVLSDDEGVLERQEVYEYGEGRLLRETHTGGDGELLSDTTYLYNEGGLLEEVHLSNPEEGLELQRVHQYNEAGRRLATRVYDGEGELVERYLFELNEQGHPATVVEENRSKKNTTHLQYDAEGHVVFQEETDLNGALANRVERNYDGEGRLLESRVRALDPRTGLQHHYIVRNEYEFFED